MMSVPSTTERLSGEASTSIGKHVAGRRFAKRSSSFRSPRSPRSGRFSCGRASHLGPPTAPNRVAGLRSQGARGGVSARAGGGGGRGQRVAGGVDGRAADERRLELERGAACPAHRLEHLAGLGRHLLPDAVAAQERDLVCRHQGAFTLSFGYGPISLTFRPPGGCTSRLSAFT